VLGNREGNTEREFGIGLSLTPTAKQQKFPLGTLGGEEGEVVVGAGDQVRRGLGGDWRGEGAR
jgi:hypothetical protein